MTEKDQIKELFAKGLQDHQVQVDPALWSSISSSIGAGAAKTGLGVLSKTLIGIAASSIIAGAVYLSLDRENPTPKKQDPKTQQETINSKEVKENIPEAPIKPTYQTIWSEPLVLGRFEINDEELFIPGLDEQTIQDTTPKAQAITSVITPTPAALSVPTQTALPALANTSSSTQAQAPMAKMPIRITLPNIFTPNGDGQNEILQIDWEQNSIEDFSIVVLNKNNEVVFRSNNPTFDWDGTDLGGEKLQKGAYVYFVTGLLNEQKWQQSSSLQIQY
jgi:gliding motility-associated-like protein